MSTSTVNAFERVLMNEVGALKDQLSEATVNVSMAIAILDTFLASSTDRGMYSASELQDLALDIRAALNKE